MKQLSKILVTSIAILYLIFLILPFVLSPVLNSYSDDIVKIIKDISGFETEIKNVRIVTTPKLTAGIKIGYFNLKLPTGESLLSVNDFSSKLSLIPILAKRIEIDSISAKEVNTNLHIKNNGQLYLLDFIPKQETVSTSQTTTQMTLPFGFRLSNNLPNITVNKYDLSILDLKTSKKYSLNGDLLKISDFVLDKKIKLLANGNFVLDNLKQFTFNIKISNKLMPELNLHDLVFSPQTTSQTNTTPQKSDFDIISVLNGINKIGITTNLETDIKTHGSLSSPVLNGFIKLDNISMNVDNEKLKPSDMTVIAKNNAISFNINLALLKDENTILNGNIDLNKNIAINCKSNVHINNMFKIINSVAKAFNINYLNTLHATGAIDADFALDINNNKVSSNGYFKIQTASILYDLYNIAIKNINANINFDDKIDIKNVSLEILEKPLRIFGTIKPNTDTELHVVSDKLQLKGLVASIGQLQLLRENDFNSGVVSLNADLTGKLFSLVPNLNLTLNDLDLKNKLTNTKIILPYANLNLNTLNKKIVAQASCKDFLVDNPSAKITLPDILIVANENEINLNDTYLLFNNSKINLSGKITDYLTNKLKFDAHAKGNIIAKDIDTLFPKEARAMFKHSGQIPFDALINGNLNTQNVILNISADSNNYYNLFDIDKIKNKSINISSKIKIENDTAQFKDTGIFLAESNTPIAKLTGNIDKISSKQILNLQINIPNSLNMVIPGFNKSNLQLSANLNILGNLLHPSINGQVKIPNISIPELLLTMDDLFLNFNGPILTGSGTLKTLKFDKIIANNLSANIFLKDYSKLHLNNINGDAFDGKINGNISYGILDGKIAVSITGKNMNATSAVEGATGIKNALSGLLGFNCDINTYGTTDIDIIKNLLGEITFEVKNGKFLNIGRFDNLLYAQNILGNAILKTVVTGISNAPLIQNTAEFSSINGKITLKDAWANIKSITSTGPLMAYYINGKYNILNSTTNVIILGRLDSKVVALLGPLGDLSVDKLTSYIPKFGALTSVIVNSMTTDPEKENTEFLPKLSSGSQEFKDFKVEYNGGLDSSSSVKSFKWLTKCDTSAINVKQDINNAVNYIKEDLQKTKDAFNRSMQNSKQQLLDAKEDIKNLFKF